MPSLDASTALTRHYRSAAIDTWTDPPTGPTKLGHLHAERAERQLRERLEAGERPPIMLVSPERAQPAKVGLGGHVRDVFAWAPPAAADNGLRHGWTHRPHVTAQLDAHDHVPDPASDYYAASGSVLVRQGQLRHLQVAGWLAPVVDQLADRYGVPVTADKPTGIEPIAAFGEGAAIIRNMLPSVGLDILTAYPRPELPLVERYDGHQPPRVAALPPWKHWGELVGEMLAHASQALGVPVNYCQGCAVLEYLPGDEFAAHTDLTDDSDTWDRTVSFSLLLNEPGVDFGGGELVINDEPQELRRGDLLGFTARTRHSVRPVTWGRRLVLVAFGEWRR